MICVGVPLWDRHVSAERNVEDTLWLCLASAIGVVVTLGVETIVFANQARGGHRRGRRGPPCRRRKLVSVFCQQLLCRPTRASKRSAPSHGRNVMLRRILQRSAYAPDYAEQMGASNRSYGKNCRSRGQSDASQSTA